MQKKPKVALWTTLTAIFAILLVASIVANYVANMYATTINVALDTPTFKVIDRSDDVYFPSDFATEADRVAYEEALCATVESEGAALLKNDNAALPLASGAKVSLFARGSVDLMYGGTGSGAVDTSKAPTMKDALTAQGIEINQSLWDWYVSVGEKYGRVTPAAISDQLAANTQYAVNEAPWAEVEGANNGSFAEYGDAAIVILSRSGGEGADLPDGDDAISMMANTTANDPNLYKDDGNTVGEEKEDVVTMGDLKYAKGQEGNGNYLELSKEEMDLLAGLKALKDNLAAALAFIQYKAEEHADTPMPTLGAQNGVNLAAMIGKDYDDAQWDALLDELTFDEMVQTITLGFHNTKMCRSINKAATKDENGPQGLTAGLVGGVSGMCYTSEDVMAATMNTELMEDVGRLIGEDCLGLGYSGLYGPGVNMHRTAYSGRNFEYYSEDPFVAGTICAAETRGIQSKGVYVYLKHVALNDSESSRRGVNTWLNEQTAREIYLEDIDKAVVDGGAWCVMSGFNRWGAQWSGEYYNLQTAYLRGELGMRGMSITDFSGLSQYMDVPDGMIGGSDIWDSPMPMIHTAAAGAYASDPYLVSEMREAMHHILYTVVNSNAMNGWNENTRIVDTTPWWQMAIYALIVCTAVLTVVSAVNLSKNVKLKKAQKQQA